MPLILHGLKNAYFYPSCSLKGQIPDASTEWKDRGGVIGQSWVGRVSSQKQAPSQHNPLFWRPSEDLSTLSTQGQTQSGRHLHLVQIMSVTVRTSSTFSADNVRHSQVFIFIECRQCQTQSGCHLHLVLTMSDTVRLSSTFNANNVRHSQAVIYI